MTEEEEEEEKAAAVLALDTKATPEAAANRRLVSGSFVEAAREAMVEAVVKSAAAEVALPTTPPTAVVDTPRGVAVMDVDPGPHTTPIPPQASTATARREGVVGVLRVGR